MRVLFILSILALSGCALSTSHVTDEEYQECLADEDRCLSPEVEGGLLSGLSTNNQTIVISKGKN